MNEFVMPAVSGGLAAMAAAVNGIPKADGMISSDGAFSGVLGALMGSQMIAANAAENVLPDIIPVEMPADDSASVIEMLFSADTETELPDGFTAEGAKAFAETVKLFADEKPLDMKAAEKLWESVSNEEKQLYAELLEGIVRITDEGKCDELDLSEAAVSVDEAVEKLIFMGEKIPVDKPAKKQKKDDETSDDITAVMFGMSSFMRPEPAKVQIVSVSGDASEENTTVSAVPDAAYTSEMSENVTTGSEVQTDDTQQNVQSVFSQAAESVSEMSPEQTRDFCEGLAKLLNEAVKAESGNEENAPVAVENSLRQAFMARAAKDSEKAELPVISKADISTAAESTNAMPDVPVPTDTGITAVQTESYDDVSVQIIEKIELYHEIAEMNSGQVKDITVNLTPDELGSVEIRVRSTDEGIVISVAAENSETAELIGDKANALAEAVASRGVKLREITVTEQIVTAESSDNALSYMNMDGRQNPYSNGQSDNSRSGTRRFVFDNGSDTVSEISSAEGSSDIYYNKEAKLWVSA